MKWDWGRSSFLSRIERVEPREVSNEPHGLDVQSRRTLHHAIRTHYKSDNIPIGNWITAQSYKKNFGAYSKNMTDSKLAPKSFIRLNPGQASYLDGRTTECFIDLGKLNLLKISHTWSKSVKLTVQ